MTNRMLLLLAAIGLIGSSAGYAQDAGLTAPTTIEAGSAFAISTGGSGSGTLYIVGPSQVLTKQVQLGGPVQLTAGEVINAGHYLLILSAASGTESTTMDVTPLAQPARVSFLAEPSRLPVALQHGIAGSVYVFDRFGNIDVAPASVSFELSTPAGPAQKESAVTRDGAAWTRLNTTAHEGVDSFVARVGNVSVSRLVDQVAGDPCQLTMSVKPVGNVLQLQTAPVRDCSGNPVPDGTIVSFSESFNGGLSTADVPIKGGIAKVELPAHPGGVITVASGVVLGNQIRWGK